MMSQLDHIENRIRWRAKKMALRTSNTGLWEKAPESLKERAGEALEKPVFFSMADESTATIVGADGTLVVDGGKAKMIPHLDLGGVYCLDVGVAAPSDKASALNLAVRNRGTIKARMENGPANYCVWKVLRMLLDMREAWFLPEPVEEPAAPEESADQADEANPPEGGVSGEEASASGDEAVENATEEAGSAAEADEKKETEDAAEPGAA